MHGIFILVIYPVIQWLYPAPVTSSSVPVPPLERADDLDADLKLLSSDNPLSTHTDNAVIQSGFEHLGFIDLLALNTFFHSLTAYVYLFIFFSPTFMSAYAKAVPTYCLFHIIDQSITIFILGFKN